MNEQPTGTASETSQPDPRKNRLWGNEDDLLERLCSDQENPYKAPERTVVFLVGAGLSQPDEKSGSGGVPNTEKIAELLLRDLHLRKLPRHERAPTNLIYQELFDRFYSRSGPEGVGAFLRKVVSEAYVGREQLSPPPGEAQCSQMAESLDD